MANLSAWSVLLCLVHLSVAKNIPRIEPTVNSDQVIQVNASDVADSSRGLNTGNSTPTTDTKASSETITSGRPVTGSGLPDAKEELKISGRMNLEIGSSVSTAYGNGGASTSAANGYAYKLGLLGPDGRYTPLQQSSNAGSYSSSFGQHSPWTSANVNLGAGLGNYGSKATASGSFGGGVGYTQSNTKSITTATDVGNGLTLLTNLAAPDKKDEASQATGGVVQKKKGRPHRKD